MNQFQIPLRLDINMYQTFDLFQSFRFIQQLRIHIYIFLHFHPLSRI